MGACSLTGTPSGTRKGPLGAPHLRAVHELLIFAGVGIGVGFLGFEAFRV